MAAAASAVKFQLRLSRLQETSVVFQERAWVQKAVGDIAKTGKFLLDTISAKSSNQGPSAGAAIIGSSCLLLPSRNAKAEGLISNDPVESRVANLAGDRDHGTSLKVKFQFVNSQTAAATNLGRDGQGKMGAARKQSRSPLAESMEEEEYGWETDPNGGWLSSFP
ncbi:unnamed protein product [Calypogeia fissa]